MYSKHCNSEMPNSHSVSDTEFPSHTQHLPVYHTAVTSQYCLPQRPYSSNSVPIMTPESPKSVSYQPQQQNQHLNQHQHQHFQSDYYMSSQDQYATRYFHSIPQALTPSEHSANLQIQSSSSTTGNAPPATSEITPSLTVTDAEQDPYFISVQGVLQPTKNSQGRYECQLCDRSYTHAKHLKRHMMRHTGQKPYGCSWCNAKFTRPDIRKRHVLKCKVRRKQEGDEPVKTEKNHVEQMLLSSVNTPRESCVNSPSGASVNLACDNIQSLQIQQTPNSYSQSCSPEAIQNIEPALHQPLSEASIKTEPDSVNSTVVYNNTYLRPPIYVNSTEVPFPHSSPPVLDNQRFYYPIVPGTYYFDNNMPTEYQQTHVVTIFGPQPVREHKNTFEEIHEHTYSSSHLESFVPPTY